MFHPQVGAVAARKTMKFTLENKLPNFSQALGSHLFEDLAEGKGLALWVRWVVATSGVASYLLADRLFGTSRALGGVLFGELLLLLAAGFSFGLGFLLAWKRERTGPVRLYVSGFFLPSLMHLTLKVGELLGAGVRQ